MSGSRKRAFWFIGIVMLLALGLPAAVFFGLKDSVPPDPNDVLQAESGGLALATRNVEELFWTLENKRANGDLDDQRASDLLQQYARQQVEQVRRTGAEKESTFTFGELLRAGKLWAEAQKVYEQVIEENPKNEDLFVNSKLRIAQCLAAQNRVPEGLAAIRETFWASSGNKPPILLGVYLDFAPVARGKGHDVEIAKVIREAVNQHLEASVNPASVSGQAFLGARRIHVQRAFQIAIALLDQAQAVDLSSQYRMERDATLERLRSVRP